MKAYLYDVEANANVRTSVSVTGKRDPLRTSTAGVVC